MTLVAPAGPSLVGGARPPPRKQPLYQTLRPQRPPPAPRKALAQSRGARKARDAYGERVEPYNPRRDARRKAERKAARDAWVHREAVRNAQANGLPLPPPPPPAQPTRRRRLRPGSMFSLLMLLTLY